MAKATPDTARALAALVDDLRGLGRELRLSDLFRSYKMSGERVDQIPNQRVGAIQAALIRLGFDPGRIDGIEGDRARSAMLAAGTAAGTDPQPALTALLAEAFPEEG
jgi:hypothetical protein